MDKKARARERLKTDRFRCRKRRIADTLQKFQTN